MDNETSAQCENLVSDAQKQTIAIVAWWLDTFTQERFDKGRRRGVQWATLLVSSDPQPSSFYCSWRRL